MNKGRVRRCSDHLIGKNRDKKREVMFDDHD